MQNRKAVFTRLFTGHWLSRENARFAILRPGGRFSHPLLFRSLKAFKNDMLFIW